MAAVVAIGLAVSLAQAHCQVPCGIYDDDARLAEMAEHIHTVEKAMLKIEEYAAERKPNHNQVVRWTLNKEKHANELMEIVTAYFMAQRIKPVDAERKEAYAKYVKEVTLLHQILVRAMKTKQSTTLEHCGELRRLIDQFEASYVK